MPNSILNKVAMAVCFIGTAACLVGGFAFCFFNGSRWSFYAFVAGITAALLALLVGKVNDPDMGWPPFV